MLKKITLLFAALLSIVTYAQGQGTNPECMTNLSIFVEHVKVKNYDAAYKPWEMVRATCPDINAAVYIYGERILKDKIEKTTGEEKSGHINDLMKLYDEGIKYFPNKYNPGDVAIDKAILMYDEKLGTDEELYNVLDEGYKKDRENFRNPKGMYLYFSTLVDLHGAGKKELQDVFDTYDDVNDRIDDEKKKLLTVVDNLLPKEEAGKLTSKETRKLEVARKNLEAFDKISGSIDAKLGALADCDKLIPLYTSNFPAKRNDAVWLKRAANRMDSKECSDDPLFIEIVDALHQLQPSAKSAYYLGFLNDKKGDSREALRYYEESLGLETDNYERAKTALKIAYKYKNSPSTARSYARKALEFQPSMGRAYLLIASLYANSANQCGNTSFEKRAVYWLAADTARRAGQVDPSLQSEASKAVNGYFSRAPSKTDIFNETMSGKTIQFNCWIGSSVKVPNL